MASDSDDDDHKGEGYIRCLQISVVIYGIVNLIIRGAELILVIISTSVIIAAYVTGINPPHPTFHDYLSAEARHAIWRGPYPNSVIDLNNINLMAQNVTPAGILPAPNLSVDGKLSAPNVSVIGNLSAPNLSVDGKLSEPNVSVMGNLSAPNVSVDGKLSATNVVVDQKLSTPNISIAGNLSPPNASVDGKSSAPNVSVIGNLSAPNLSVDGKLSAPSVAVDGKLSAPSVAVDEKVSTPNASVGTIGFLSAPDIPTGITPATNEPVGVIKSVIDATQEKLNLYVWSTYFLMKIINVAFSFLLICSAKKFSFSGNLAWLAFSIPILAQYLLQFILDLSFGDYFQRELPSQIWQGVDIGYQLLGIVMVSIFLNLLYHMDDKIRGIDRYNGFPSSRINGDISITEIIENEDDQRFKL